MSTAPLTAIEPVPGISPGFAPATLFPGYFALVMATGIVSLAAHFQGLERIARGLFWLNAGAYLGLWSLTGWRMFRFPREFIGDLTHPIRGVSFLTKVAGTCVLGTQFAVLTPWMPVAKALWVVGVALWGLLIYLFFTVATVREPKPPLEWGISGAWLLSVVATESISVLGAQIARGAEVELFTALAMYLLGAMFYLLFITLIVYRWMFFSMKAESLTPPYWINMGALAITTLAGARLLIAGQSWAWLQRLEPFLKGFTLFFWVTGTWWIPLLVIVGVWRHLFQHVPLRYDPQYWSMVFPLGMYSAATAVFAQAAGLPFLNLIAVVFVYVGLTAWTITFAAMLYSLVPRSRGGPR